MYKRYMYLIFIYLCACDSASELIDTDASDCRDNPSICGAGTSCQESNTGTYACVADEDLLRAGESIGENAGEMAGESAGENAGESAGENAGEMAGESAGENAGELAGESAGENAGELAGENAGESAGENAGESAGENAGESAGDVTTCSTCDMCEPIICVCDGRNVSVNNCQDECCLTRDEVDCDNFCATAELCEPTTMRCVPQRPRSIDQCDANSMWVTYPCDPGYLCQLDQCLPASCREGEIRCLDEQQTLVCSNGTWTVGDQCDEVCFQNECTTYACSTAAINQSYIGCEYVAKELPNLIHKPSSIDQHFPTAIVLSNLSEDMTAYINIYDAEHQSIDLIQTRDLVVPATLPITFVGDDISIASEVRDAQGVVVEANILNANNVAIPPQGIGIFLLPQAEWYEGSFIDNQNYRVVSDYPVNAYQFSPYCCNYSFSNDASLLIPTSAAGVEYKFLGLPNFVIQDTFNFNLENSPATLTVIAHQDNTDVHFVFPPYAQVEPSLMNRMVAVGDGYTIRIQQQESITFRTIQTLENVEPDQLLDAADLTGTSITSNHPINVLSGHQCSFYPQAYSACDHLEESLFPVSTWGQNFSLVPVKERGNNVSTEKTYWKILAESGNVRINLSRNFSELNASVPGAPGVPYCGNLLEDAGNAIRLDERGFCEFGSKEAVDITGDQRLSVMGIITSQTSVAFGSTFGEHLGDPAIFLVPPSLQFRNEYSFLTPDTYYYDYLTLTFVEGTTITLDGVAVDTSNAENITGSDKQYMYVELEDGPHQVSADQPFGITVFAFDDFVSYAFTGGLNLIKH